MEVVYKYNKLNHVEEIQGKPEEFPELGQNGMYNEIAFLIKKYHVFLLRL